MFAFVRGGSRHTQGIPNIPVQFLVSEFSRLIRDMIKTTYNVSENNRYIFLQISNTWIL